MNKNAAQSQVNGTIWQRLLGILGSMNMAIVLLLTLCLMILAGTLTDQNQPTAYYKEMYGSFWTAFFQSLRLFELYSSPWFLLIVSLLIVSIATCLWRNSPSILASFGRNSREYHPGKFSRERGWEVDGLSSEKLADIKQQFTRRGYLVNSQAVGEALHIHANRGGQQKLGYLIIHVSILIIFLGGILDGNVFKSFNIPGYDTYINSYSTKPDEVPADKILPVTNTAFSATRTLPLGQAGDTVMIREKAGYYLQKLPFHIHLKELESHFYADGSPKDYQAALTLVDDDGKSVTGDVSARQSLAFNGFTISQRGIADSDARLVVSLYSFDNGKALVSEKEIELPFKFEGGDKQSIVFDNYKLQNADPSQAVDMSKEFVDIGPSFQYHLKNMQGDVVNIEYYLEPYSRDGVKYYLFKVSKQGSKPTIIFLPLDHDHELKHFLAFNHILYDKKLIRNLFATQLKSLFKDVELESDYLQKQAVEQIMALLQDYAMHGRDFAIQNQIKSIKEIDQETASIYMEKMLDQALLIVFKQVLLNELEEQGKSAKAENISVDMNYFGQLEKAVDQFKKMDIRYFPVIINHSQSQGVVLSVNRHPGKYVVLGGMMALALGVLMIFYINYREYLVKIINQGGKARIQVDAYTNRSDIQFGKEFINLTDVLISVTI